jgi:hypothetical protein
MLEVATLLLGAVLSPGIRSADSCLSYEPAAVRFTGVLVRRVLPGPPNYESIQQGDAPEPTFFVVLTRPICVSGDSTSEVNTETEAGLDTIQVGPDDSNWTPFRRLVGRRVEVSGTLSHAITGHHRTRVVMAVGTIKRVDQ